MTRVDKAINTVLDELKNKHPDDIRWMIRKMSRDVRSLALYEAWHAGKLENSTQPQNNGDGL